MRILVLGATWFVGRAVVEDALQTGAEGDFAALRAGTCADWLSSWTTDSPRRCHSIRSGSHEQWRLGTDPPAIIGEFRRETRSMQLVHHAAR